MQEMWGHLISNEGGIRKKNLKKTGGKTQIRGREDKILKTGIKINNNTQEVKERKKNPCWQQTSTLPLHNMNYF